MKRLIVIALAIVCGVACSESFAKKPKKAELKETQKEELRNQEGKEFREIQEQIYLDSIKLAEKKRELEAEIERLKMEYSRSEAKGPLPVYEEIELPCQEEAISTDEYYGALGISEGEPNAQYAITKATTNAQIELFNIVGEDINVDEAMMVCRQVYRDSYGTWNAYIALRLSKTNNK